jgi:hypothetical protein
MAEETFIKAYEINLEFCYLHILIIFFPCGFKKNYGIYKLRKEGVSRLKMTIEKTKYILMYSIFFTYYEQDMAKSKLVVNNYNNVYQGWHE